jgi:hypothetical protein
MRKPESAGVIDTHEGAVGFRPDVVEAAFVLDNVPDSRKVVERPFLVGRGGYYSRVMTAAGTNAKCRPALKMCAASKD